MAEVSPATFAVTDPLTGAVHHLRVMSSEAVEQVAHRLFVVLSVEVERALPQAEPLERLNARGCILAELMSMFVSGARSADDG